MKEIDGWVKIKKYTDDEGKPVCSACRMYTPAVEHNGCEDDTGELTLSGQQTPGPTCPVWHGESKSEWQPIESAPSDRHKMFVAIAIDVPVSSGLNRYTSDPWCVWMNADRSFARWPHPFPPTHYMLLPPQENKP